MTAYASVRPNEPASRRLLWLLALALVTAATFKVWMILQAQPPGTDFLPVWTAGRLVWRGPALVYDIAAISHAETWLKPVLPWPRPFAYPPTALLLFAPLGRAPFWIALGIWLAASLACFSAASLRMAGDFRRLSLLLALAAPPVVFSVLAGQPVLFVAGLAAFATIELPHRPHLAGALFAVAAALKPQALLLAPVALVAAGAMEALTSAAVTGIVLVAASLIAFGPAPWVQWLGCFAPFETLIESTPELAAGVVTPNGAGLSLGLGGAALALWRLAFALAGLLLTWRAFARASPPAARLAALAGGSLLVAPYAMYYDAALLAPALAVIAAERISRDWPIRLLAYGAMCEMVEPRLGLIALCVAMICSLERRHAPVDEAAARPRTVQ